MSCCSKIAEMLKKVLSSLGPILAIALLCFAAYLLVVSSGAAASLIAAMEGFVGLPTFLVGLEATTWAYIAIGLAVVVSPETVTDLASNAGSFVGKTVGNIAGAVAAGVVGGATGFASGGLGSVVLYAALGWGAWMLFKQKKEHDKEAREEKRDELRFQRELADSRAPSLGVS